MITCINRCVLMISLAMWVFEMASATAVFTVQRGEPGRYIRERKLLLAARDLRDTDQRVYDIYLKYGFDSQQTFTRVFTGPSISRRGAYRKENHSRARGAPLWFNARGKPATPHQRSTRYSMAPSAKNHRQNSTV